MTGTFEPPENEGRLRLSIAVRGLAPGEVVSLRAAGEYVATWVCGVDPGQCGDAGCGPAFSGGPTEGTAEAAAQAVGASDGTAAALIELVAAPPAKSCPADSTAPWATPTERWERVRIADPAHGLLLTPDTIERAITI